MRIDVNEAGRESALGPMAAVAVQGDPDALSDGIVDSKRLVPGRREELTAKLRERGDVSASVTFVKPETVDDPETGTNLLTAWARVEAAVEVAVDADELVCDTGDMSESRFGRRICKGLAGAGVSVAARARHHADDEHATVGTVSVMARVERGRRVEAIASEYDEIGSGYPSDGTAREFLREYVRDHGILSDYARKSWSTCVDLVVTHEQSSLGDF